MSRADFNKFGDAHTCIWCKCCYCWLSEWPSRERLFIYTDTRTHSLSNSQAPVAGSLAPSPRFASVPRRAAQSSSQRHFTPPILLILMHLPHTPAHFVFLIQWDTLCMYQTQLATRVHQSIDIFAGDAEKWLEGGDWPNGCFFRIVTSKIWFIFSFGFITISTRLQIFRIGFSVCSY